MKYEPYLGVVAWLVMTEEEREALAFEAIEAEYREWLIQLLEKHGSEKKAASYINTWPAESGNAIGFEGRFMREYLEHPTRKMRPISQGKQNNIFRDRCIKADFKYLTKGEGMTVAEAGNILAKKYHCSFETARAIFYGS